MRDQLDVREMFDRLHSQESFQKIAAKSHRAMICQKDSLVAADERA
jgi:hypothetical protein